MSEPTKNLEQITVRWANGFRMTYFLVSGGDYERPTSLGFVSWKEGESLYAWEARGEAGTIEGRSRSQYEAMQVVEEETKERWASLPPPYPEHIPYPLPDEMVSLLPHILACKEIPGGIKALGPPFAVLTDALSGKLKEMRLLYKGTTEDWNRQWGVFVEETLVEGLKLTEKAMRRGPPEVIKDQEDIEAELWWGARSQKEAQKWVERMWPFGPWRVENISKRAPLMRKVYDFAKRNSLPLNLEDTVALICKAPSEDGLQQKVIVTVPNKGEKYATIQFSGLMIKLKSNGTWESYDTSKPGAG